MKTLTWLSVLVIGIVALAGCSGMGLVIKKPTPIELREDYRQEYTYGGKDAFYYKSYLLVVNSSHYKVKIVQDGFELPMFYQPYTEMEIKVKNVLYKDIRTSVVAVAYGHHNQVIGKVEKTFVFNGTGKQQVEQWVLKDWMFDK